MVVVVEADDARRQGLVCFFWGGEERKNKRGQREVLSVTFLCFFPPCFSRSMYA